MKCKGRGDETIVNKIVREVYALGYRKLIIKTDGEPALVEVQEAIARARVHDTFVKIHLPMISRQAVGLKEQCKR